MSEAGSRPVDESKHRGIEPPECTDASLPLAQPSPLRSAVGCWVTFLGSFGLGTIVGLYHCDWQVPLESAQVYARVVEYPADHGSYPYYLRHVQAWSLLSQACAPFLAFGVPEETLSIALCGLMGGIAFAGFGLIAYALCRNPWLSLLAAVAPYHMFGPGLPYNSTYPIEFLGTIHTYGAIGPCTALFCLAVMGLDRPRLAGFCCAAAPAVHPTWGSWTFGVVALALLWQKLECRPWSSGSRPSQRTTDDGQQSVDSSSRWWPGLLAGGLVTAASLGWQLWMARVVPPVPAETQAEYLQAFLKMWDFHRRNPLPLLDRGMVLTLACALLSLVWLLRDRGLLSPGGRNLLRACLVSSVLAYVMAALALWMPETIVRAIPTRFINLSVLAYPALLCGLLGVAAGSAGGRLLLLAHVLYLWGHRFVLTDSYWHYREFLAVGAGCVLLALSEPRPKAADSRGPQLPYLPMWLSVTCAAAFVLTAGEIIRRTHAVRHAEFAAVPGTDDAAVEAAAQGSGVLIVAGDLKLMQLRTGRPVLLPGWALDDLVYFPNLGPSMNRVLTRVYDIDLLDPPADIRGSRMGALSPASGRDAWERRSREDWRRIGAEFRSTQVLTPPGWTLDLPLVAESPHLLLYAIPAAGGEERVDE